MPFIRWDIRFKIMNRHSLYIFIILAIVTTIQAAAQRDNRHDRNVVTVANSDTVDAARVERHLKSNAPQAPNDNGLPRFAIVGKDHKFYLGIGAQFLGEGVFDFGDYMPSPTLFTPSAITRATAGNGASLRFAWQSSSVYLNFVALPESADRIGLFFKCNFLGNGNTFNFLHAYAVYRGLSVGYTASLFTDAAAEPMTIDYEGPNGYPYMTLFTAYWTQQFTADISAAVGIDAPSASITDSSGAFLVSQRIPAFPFYLQYARDEGASHIRLSGLYRPIQYRDAAAAKNHTLNGLGIQLSGMSKIVGGLSAGANVAYGRGISSYLQDDNGLSLDAVPVAAGKMAMCRSLGITGSLSYTFTDRLTSNIVYSRLTNWLPAGAADRAVTYRYGNYLAANLIYTVNAFLSAGIEYDYGNRTDFAGNDLHVNRLQVQMAVTF